MSAPQVSTVPAFMRKHPAAALRIAGTQLQIELFNLRVKLRTGGEVEPGDMGLLAHLSDHLHLIHDHLTECEK